MLDMSPMPPNTRKLRRHVGVALISIGPAVACHDATDAGPPPTRAIRVSASTTGVDVDDDGYAVTLEGSAIPAFRLGPNASVTVDSLEGASYSVRLADVADNCAVAGPNPRSVVVTPSTVPAVADFAITCAARGTVQISNVTTGSPPDVDGYVVRLERGLSVTSVIVPTAGTADVKVASGSYTVSLQSVAANCVVTAHPGGPTRRIDVASGATTALSFATTCGPTPVREIAFVRDGRIYGVNPDGTGLAQLSDGPADSDPAWSPDGRIAFARRTGEDKWGADFTDIHVMDADGSNVVRLTTTGHNRQPTWSPDGRRIAYASRCGGQGCILIIPSNAAAVNPVQVGFTVGFMDGPAWSPDGRKIAFTSDYRAYDFVYDLYVVDIQTGATGVLVEGPFFFNDGNVYYFQPAWSPGGDRVAAVACPRAWDDCFPNSYIAVVNADGSGLKQITTAGGFARPTWSADGSRIAFGSTTCRTCSSDVYVVLQDGSDRRLLIANGHSPSWRW